MSPNAFALVLASASVTNWLLMSIFLLFSARIFVLFSVAGAIGQAALGAPTGPEDREPEGNLESALAGLSVPFAPPVRFDSGPIAVAAGREVGPTGFRPAARLHAIEIDTHLINDIRRDQVVR